jgi:short-subunit dehydrogenase
VTKNVLILGATSCISEHYARRCAARGESLFLAGRNKEKLNVIKKDLEIRGAKRVELFYLDLNDTKAILKMMKTAWAQFKHFDIALIAYGTLTEQLKSETDFNYLISDFRNNAESVIVLISILSQAFVKRNKGTIAVIGSVAGDRGRASNYSYAAAKSAIETFMSGMRMKYHSSRLNYLLIKPGFVKTPMTAHLSLPAILVAPPQKIAKDIDRAILNKKDCIYTPWFWAYIMFFIKHTPNFIFKRFYL